VATRVGPIRRAIGLVCALALTIAGSYGLGYILLYMDEIPGWGLLFSIGAGALGLFWLWEDYINAEPKQ
jgi:hypothetical protein